VVCEEPTNPINSFGPATPCPLPTIACKKIHSRGNTPAAPPHEYVNIFFPPFFIFKFICSRIKKKAEPESKNCHAKIMFFSSSNFFFKIVTTGARLSDAEKCGSTSRAVQARGICMQNAPPIFCVTPLF